MGTLRINGSSSGYVELVAPAVSGSTSLNLPLTGIAKTGPTFRAYNSASQSISANTATKIVLDSTSFNIGSCFNTTNYRFTPNVAGYYQVNCNIYFQGTTSQYSVTALYKNGSMYQQLNSQRNNGNWNNCSFSELVYMNGTTDYLELFGYENLAVTTVAGQCTLSASLVAS